MIEAILREYKGRSGQINIQTDPAVQLTQQRPSDYYIQ